MTFCIALTGCYGVSQEEYNSVVSQNIELQSQNEQLQAELKEADEAIEQSQRELNEANSQQEDAEIKETEDTENYIQYVTPNGQIWLIDDAAIRECFTAIDTNKFVGKTDKDIINAVYDIVEDFAFSYMTNENCAMLSYLYVLNFDGEAIGYATMQLNNPSENGVTWLGKYENYNEHSENISCAKDFMNFGGSKSDITLNNYSIHFSGEYDFAGIETAGDWINSYLSLSDSKASEFIAIDVEVTNNAFSERSFDVAVVATAPSGKTLYDCSPCFDDGIFDSLVKIPSKESVNKRFYVPYEGDGEYKLNFGDPFDTVKQVYIIEINKS